MEHSLTSHELVTAAASCGGGLFLALVVRFVFGRLMPQSKRRASTADNLVIASLRELLPAALIIGGLWLAAAQLPLRPRPRSISDHILLGASILVVTLVAARVAVVATRAFALRRSGVAPSTTIFANVVRVLVLAVGILVMLQSLGVAITPLLTALGVGGLAVALALQDTLTNLFAGIHILASKKIEPGDYIKMTTGEEGYVMDVNWRNTAVRALPDNMILIPNAKLSSEIVVNYHRPFPQMSVLIQVGVSYDSDLEDVERVTIEVAREVMQQIEGGVPQHDPFIRFHTFGESSIDFSVILRAREFTDQYLITHEFIKRLHRRYHAEGIEIPFPIRTVVTRAAAA